MDYPKTDALYCSADERERPVHLVHWMWRHSAQRVILTPAFHLLWCATGASPLLKQFLNPNESYYE